MFSFTSYILNWVSIFSVFFFFFYIKTKVLNIVKTIKYLKLKGKKEIKTMKRIMLGSNGPGMREKERKKKNSFKGM